MILRKGIPHLLVLSIISIYTFLIAYVKALSELTPLTYLDDISSIVNLLLLELGE